MKQAILLDSRDLAMLREGKPLVIHVGDASIELAYRATNNTPGNQWTCPQCKKAMAIQSKGGHAKMHNLQVNKWTCPICDVTMHKQGRGPHQRMHERAKGNKK
jgi:transposase-like protein